MVYRCYRNEIWCQGRESLSQRYSGLEEQRYCFLCNWQAQQQPARIWNLQLAIQKYPDAHPLFHSDRGFQYTSKQFKDMLEKQGMRQSMSRVGRCIDNGPMEGFWGILKCEMYYLNHFETYEELVHAVGQFIHYYNHQRRQHRLNCLAPMDYRRLLEAA